MLTAIASWVLLVYTRGLETLCHHAQNYHPRAIQLYGKSKPFNSFTTSRVRCLPHEHALS